LRTQRVAEGRADTQEDVREGAVDVQAAFLPWEFMLKTWSFFQIDKIL
jgi:hypothetical protein